MADPAPLPRPAGTPIRDRLIEAAVQEFGEQGYDRARVQDIARRAGLSTGAIYGNFRNKADLLAEAVDHGLAGVAHRLGEALHQGVAPAELLERITARLSDPDRRRWAALVSEALAAARRDPEVARRVHTALQAVEERLTDLARLAQRDGSVAAGIDPSAFARLVLYVSIGVDVLGALGVRNPDDEAWASTVHHLFAGLHTARPVR